MIIKKWIEYQKEIEISLSAEDISLLFKENEDEKHNQSVMLCNVNSIANFLKGIPQEVVDGLSDKLRQTISDFFKEQSNRFNSATYEALKIAKPFPVLQTDFVETLAMVFESSEEISGGRASELMDNVVHLLKCRSVCFKHGLMREVMNIDETLTNPNSPTEKPNDFNK